MHWLTIIFLTNGCFNLRQNYQKEEICCWISTSIVLQRFSIFYTMLLHDTWIKIQSITCRFSRKNNYINYLLLHLSKCNVMIGSPPPKFTTIKREFFWDIKWKLETIVIIQYQIFTCISSWFDYRYNVIEKYKLLNDIKINI